MSDEEVDAVAVSYGPGLMGSLLVGVETAKVLAWAWKKPLLKVNHMAAHVMANWILAESDTVSQWHGEACPECGHELIFKEGCSTCTKCGFSKCSL